MNFDKLDAIVPEITESDDGQHANTFYWTGGHGWAVRLKWPGKYKSKSRGDFVIETLDTRVWSRYKQVKHSDMFADYADKLADGLDLSLRTIEVVSGRSDLAQRVVDYDGPGMHPDAFLATMLSLAVCEHRRYPQAALKGGGRYLPINFMLAIRQQTLTVDSASSQVRYGLPVLERLDNFFPFTSNDIPAVYWESHPVA